MKISRIIARLLCFAAVIAATPVGLKAVSPSRAQLLHTFTGSANGGSPSAALVRGTDGSFYGTTERGGASDAGAVFKMSPSGTVTLLYSFTGGADGSTPRAALIQGNDGLFYGTTYSGGTAGNGTIFRMTPAGNVTPVFSFPGGGLGARPRAALLLASNGTFMGTTESGGAFNRGTVFEVNLNAGTFIVRHDFDGLEDGSFPYAPLIEATDGNYYGTTYAGDLSTLGRVFRISPAGVVTVLHTFVGGADGADPMAALVQATDGNFYGTTRFGGAANQGTVFRMTPGGAVTILKSFSGGADGGLPRAALIQGSDGAFYSTTQAGGAGYGVVFKIASDGAFTVLYTLTGGPDGANPSAPLIQAPSGQLYGTTSFGGGSDLGTIFRLPPSVPFDFDGDSRTDIAVYRPSTGIWYVRQSSNGAGAFLQWGLNGDVPVAGDYDGDGKTDVAVFRPSTGIWYVRNAVNETAAFYQWGLNGDIPVPDDYDSDGKSDIAVFRPSTGIWYVRNSATGTNAFLQWGLNGDIPVAGDYDGDRRIDLAVFRPSTGIWYVRNPATETAAFYQWGLSGDIPVPGDYDGDGRTDVAVFRPSTGIWYVRNAATETASFYQWGLSGDIPVEGDYDGDGKTDVAVFRPSTGIWYVRYSTTGGGAFFQWGLNGDTPSPKRP